MSINRVKSWIPGFDKLICGGFVEKSIVLVSGESGTGKTMFSLQYVLNGIKERGERGYYMTFEEPVENIIACLDVMDDDAMEHVKNGNLQIENFMVHRKNNDTLTGMIGGYNETIPINIETMRDFISKMKSTLEIDGVKRLVIDSITALGIRFDDSSMARQQLFSLVNAIRDLGCTTILISDAVYNGDKWVPRLGIEQYLVDGVIMLEKHVDPVTNVATRSLLVEKMRITNHDLTRQEFVMDDRGKIDVKGGNEPVSCKTTRSPGLSRERTSASTG